MIDIADIKVLKLDPGQILVVKTEYVLDAERRNAIRKYFEDSVPLLEGRLLIIDGYFSLSVLDATAT